MLPVTDAQAKAVAEAAKMGQQILDTAKKFLDEPAAASGGFLAEWINGKRVLWRMGNVLSVMRRAIEISEELQRISPREGDRRLIGARVGTVLIDAIADEDDQNVQEIYARLIAKASGPNNGVNIKRVFIEILRNLEPLGVRVLEELRALLNAADPLADRGQGIWLADFAVQVGAPARDILTVLYHLKALGCVSISDGLGFAPSEPPPPFPFVLWRATEILPTPLLIELLEACAAPGEPSLECWFLGCGLITSS